MKFEIKNRWSGKVQITAEIECANDASYGIRLGVAVRWAIKSGANFADAYLADANLAGAYLAGAYLARADLAGANFAGANFAGANLAGANLAGADLAGANLAGANFADAYLAGADLADANLAGALKIDDAHIPIVDQIDSAILAKIEAGGTLDMSSWHANNPCGTTHCRAGWAVHLAGVAGAALEDRIGPHMAGTLIYQKSRPNQPTPWFFASNDDALADIKKCAAEQTAK